MSDRSALTGMERAMVRTVSDIANKLRRAESRYRVNKVKYVVGADVGVTASYYFTDGRRDGIRETARAILYVWASLRPGNRRVLSSAFRASWHASKAAVTAPAQTPGGAL